MKSPASFVWAMVWLAVLVFFTGCASVSETRRYYRPSTTEVFPRKSSGDPMAMLDHRPARAHRVIGRLTFTAEEDRSFMLEAAEYNGREAGADATVIVSLRRSEEPWKRWVPASTTYEPVSTTIIHRDEDYGYRRRRHYDHSSLSMRAPKVCKKDDDKKKKKKKKKHDEEHHEYHGYVNTGSTITETQYVPRYHPGYMEHGVTVKHSIDALMIRYLDSNRPH